MISMVALSVVHLYIVGSIPIWVKPMTIKALIFKLVCGPILPRQGFGVRSRPETTDILSTKPVLSFQNEQIWTIWMYLFHIKI